MKSDAPYLWTFTTPALETWLHAELHRQLQAAWYKYACSPNAAAAGRHHTAEEAAVL